MTTDPPSQEKSLSTWRLLATRRDFSKLITARFISFLGDNVHTVTTMWVRLGRRDASLLSA